MDTLQAHGRPPTVSFQHKTSHRRPPTVGFQHKRLTDGHPRWACSTNVSQTATHGGLAAQNVSQTATH
eukprot:4388529-Pyramimonas_sp.AAC.1